MTCSRVCTGPDPARAAEICRPPLPHRVIRFHVRDALYPFRETVQPLGDNSRVWKLRSGVELRRAPPHRRDTDPRLLPSPASDLLRVVVAGCPAHPLRQDDDYAPAGLGRFWPRSPLTDRSASTARLICPRTRCLRFRRAGSAGGGGVRPHSAQRDWISRSVDP